MSDPVTQPLGDDDPGGIFALTRPPSHPPVSDFSPTATTLGDSQSALSSDLPQTPEEFQLPFQVGHELGPVKLMARIGRGGMGTVFLGYHRLLGRNVAVKFLHVHLEDHIPGGASSADGHWEQFFGEARAAASVRHLNLTEIYHADIARGAPYLVLEHVDGPNLSQLLESSGPLPVYLAVHVLIEVATAMAELHDAGVIHRDIKPSNVMVDVSGRVVLTDLGLALRRLSLLNPATAPICAGTPAYMAPEMFEGRASPRSDIYALGILAFRILTGKVPFEGSVTALREKHLTEKIPLAPLRTVGIDDALLEMLERSLHKQFMFRYKTAHEFARALQHYAETAPLPDSMNPRTSRVARRRGRSSLDDRASHCRAELERLVREHRHRTTAPPSSTSASNVDRSPHPPESPAADQPSPGSTPASAPTPISASSSYADTIARAAAAKRERHRTLLPEPPTLRLPAPHAPDTTPATPPPADPPTSVEDPAADIELTKHLPTYAPITPCSAQLSESPATIQLPLDQSILDSPCFPMESAASPSADHDAEVSPHNASPAPSNLATDEATSTATLASGTTRPFPRLLAIALILGAAILAGVTIWILAHRS